MDRKGPVDRKSSADRKSKADWQATVEEILAERRQQLGAAPTSEDFIALRAGELSAEERQHLLEHAAVDAAVARELFDTLRFPESSGDQASSDQDSQAEEEGVGERWQALRQRLEGEGALLIDQSTPVPRRSWWPLAAMFAIGAGVALLTSQLGEPEQSAARVNLSIIELLPSGYATTGSRGSPETATLAADAEGLVLALAVPELSSALGLYSLILIRPDGDTSDFAGMSPGPGGVFLLDLPRRAWSSGAHHLILIDSSDQSIARFQLEVELLE